MLQLQECEELSSRVRGSNKLQASLEVSKNQLGATLQCRITSRACGNKPRERSSSKNDLVREETQLITNISCKASCLSEVTLINRSESGSAPHTMHVRQCARSRDIQIQCIPHEVHRSTDRRRDHTEQCPRTQQCSYKGSLRSLPAGKA